MYLRVIQPIRDKEAYATLLQKQMESAIYYAVFAPLFDALKGAGAIHNAPNMGVLVRAFESRKLHYDSGFVFGNYTGAISKALLALGAKFNKTRKAYRIDLSQFPVEVRASIARGAGKEQQALDAVTKTIQSLASRNILIPALDKISDVTLEDLHSQFQKVTPRDLEIPIEMNEAREKFIREDYTTNVLLELNDLTRSAVTSLRTRVALEVGKGTRAENLQQILFAQYGVVSNRAKFIARQETSLFVAKYRQVRYEEAGLNEYQWSTSHDERVRPDHAALNGMIFRWDDPPITDRRTGQRNNPGEDFGCRCVALPVVREAGTGKNLLETDEHFALHAGGASK